MFSNVQLVLCPPKLLLYVKDSFGKQFFIAQYWYRICMIRDK